MGYLIDTSQTLNYQQTKLLSKYIKEHGIIQFLLLYKKFKDSVKEEVYWGDEIESHLIHIDQTTKIPKLQLNIDYMFNSLASEEFCLLPEYGGWMLETTPKDPYRFTGDPNIVLKNLNIRRETIRSLCREGDALYAGTVFFLLNVGDFYVPRHQSQPIHSEKTLKEQNSSMSARDGQVLEFTENYEIVNPHPRYATSSEIIKQRRGERVRMLVPIYQDEKTLLEKSTEEPYPGYIFMDQAYFGTGNASLQVTFGAKDLDEARYLTDQLAIFSSIVLPLSAASAVFKGKLADVDLRWNLLTECVDCRNAAERDPSNSSYIPKSRWSSMSQYISNRPQCKDKYNDIACPMNSEIIKYAEEKAKELGIEIDNRLLKHLGFLFARDPLVIFSDKVLVDDSKNTNHFENIQSTNWNNVRFKPPPSFDSEIGWRVELRTIEAQLTSEETVAFAMFSYFFVLLVTKKEYNFYIPISKVDINIERAHKRDAVLTEKFWFRKRVEKDSPDEYVELSIDEILHGKSDVFVGLFNLIYKFCKEEYGVDIQNEWENKKINPEAAIDKVAANMMYFEILSKRSRGEMPTIAHWIRSFVLNHPKYQKDSIVSPEIAADLTESMLAISDSTKTYQDFI